MLLGAAAPRYPPVGDVEQEEVAERVLGSRARPSRAAAAGRTASARARESARPGASAEGLRGTRRLRARTPGRRRPRPAARLFPRDRACRAWPRSCPAPTRGPAARRCRAAVALGEHADELLGVERVAACTGEKGRLQARRQHGPLEELLEKLRRLLVGQGRERDASGRSASRRPSSAGARGARGEPCRRRASALRSPIRRGSRRSRAGPRPPSGGPRTGARSVPAPRLPRGTGARPRSPRRDPRGRRPSAAGRRAGRRCASTQRASSSLGTRSSTSRRTERSTSPGESVSRIPACALTISESGQKVTPSPYGRQPPRRHETSSGSSSTTDESSRTSRDLPIPGGPTSVTSCAECSCRARAKASQRSCTSAVRPTSGARPRSRGSAPTRERAPTASQARTGSALPLARTGSNARYSIARAVARYVASPTRMPFTGAAAWRRAATLTKSATIRSPSPGPTSGLKSASPVDDADPDGELRALRSLGEIGDRVPDLERRAHGSLGVVFVGDRCAEDRHRRRRR